LLGETIEGFPLHGDEITLLQGCDDRADLVLGEWLCLSQWSPDSVPHARRVNVAKTDKTMKFAVGWKEQLGTIGQIPNRATLVFEPWLLSIHDHRDQVSCGADPDVELKPSTGMVLELVPIGDVERLRHSGGRARTDPH
jgi:hypothetical protein